MNSPASAEVAQICAELSAFERETAQLAHFAIDGWCSPRGRETADKLHRLGLFVGEEDGDDQYTLVRFTPTPLGKAVQAYLAQVGAAVARHSDAYR